MRVGERMTREVITVGPGQSLGEAEGLMGRHGVRHLPVVQRGTLVGLVTDRDLKAARPSPATTLTVGEIHFQMSRIRVEEVMRREVATVSPVTPLAEAARLMRDRAIEALPVIKDRKVVGILTETDLMRLLGALVQGDTQEMETGSFTRDASWRDRDEAKGLYRPMDAGRRCQSSQDCL